MEPTLKDIEAVYHAAMEKPPAERAAFVAVTCGDNVALGVQVMVLLETHEKAGDFLESPVFCPYDMPLDSPLATEGPGSHIDAYELLEKIGEGGMAVVYMAAQERPLRRRVALKIIKLGMDTKQVIARFEAERQVLAMMDHANIARVFDAGATETGRPYFVMELVRGVSITEYCDKNRLSTQERLALFVPVCHAVHHAHQKGIIHRDLKPSNIMVTMHDGQPVPKVIDFGIAKATDQRLTEHTVFTRYAEMIGTPQYMSPEQAEMSGLDIDIRTDIYSLGIVLYELLTGTPPFDSKTLRHAAMGEIQRIIREEEPLRPSTRISTLGKAAVEIAAQRATNVSGLAKHLSRELEWIPMKALRKDRERRYASASEFAHDIQNYLSDKPLLAGPESAWYRLRKGVHKHRIPVMAAVVVFMILMTGLIISTSLYVHMRHAQNTISEITFKAEVDIELGSIQDLYAKGQYRTALQEIEALLLDQDLGPKARLLRAQLRLEVGRFKEAEAELLQLTLVEAEIAGAAHSLLAQAYLIVNPAKADQHKKKAESLLPKTAEAFYLRAMTVASVGEAVPWLDKAVGLDSKHYAARRARALAFQGSKAYQKMAVDAGALIVLRAHDYLGYALRAIARRETGQLEEALKDHDRAITFCHTEEELPRLHGQRRKTHMRIGDYQAALEDAWKDDEDFSAFPALLALGRYDRAQANYQRWAKLGTRPARYFKAFVEAHAIELLSSGQSFELRADIAQKKPFFYMTQAAEFYSRISKTGSPLSVASWLGDWSPDGQQIVYRRSGAFGWLPETRKQSTPDKKMQFIEILDLKTGKKQQISRFGTNPIWSPDGKHIAFRQYPDKYPKADVWLVSSTGGMPRKLTAGTVRGWSQDSRHIYFTTEPLGALCSMAVDAPDAEPVPVPEFQTKNLCARALSPDGSLVATYRASEVRVVTFPKGREVARWATPWPLQAWATDVRWHPNGKTVMLNSTSDYNQMGMCLFDIEEKQVTHVLNQTRPWCMAMWSPDGSQLIVDPYFGQPWLLDIDPNRPLDEVLAPALHTDEFLKMLVTTWDKRIKADPDDSESYVSRALVRMAAKDLDGAQHDLTQCIALVNEPDDPAVYALEHWAQTCLEDERLHEAALWALARAHIVEKLLAYAPNLNGQAHPYKQLVQIYTAQGDKQKQVEWQQKWQQAQDSSGN